MARAAEVAVAGKSRGLTTSLFLAPKVRPPSYPRASPETGSRARAYSSAGRAAASSALERAGFGQRAAPSKTKIEADLPAVRGRHECSAVVSGRSRVQIALGSIYFLLRARGWRSGPRARSAPQPAALLFLPVSGRRAPSRPSRLGVDSPPTATAATRRAPHARAAMPPAPPPPAWQATLARALDRAGSPAARYLQVATVKPDGRPTARTVVFRGWFDGAYGPRLGFVSDAR